MHVVVGSGTLVFFGFIYTVLGRKVRGHGHLVISVQTEPSPTCVVRLVTSVTNLAPNSTLNCLLVVYKYYSRLKNGNSIHKVPKKYPRQLVHSIYTPLLFENLVQGVLRDVDAVFLFISFKSSLSMSRREVSYGAVQLFNL
jgi:hypothetical protein